MEDAALAADVERLAESLGELPEPIAKPVLVAVSGLPGSGKSYFSSQLAERFPLVILESDVLRKILFSSPSYSVKENSYFFRVVHRLIEKLVKKGIPVILDATNLSERHREYLYSIAERWEAKLVLVRVEAPAEVVRWRLERRLKSTESKSDADWSVYRRMESSVQQIRRKHYAVDTSRDITPVLDKIVKEVIR